MVRKIWVDYTYVKQGKNKGTFRAGLDVAQTLKENGENVVCITGCYDDKKFLESKGFKAEHISISNNKYIATIQRIKYFWNKPSKKEDRIVFVGSHILGKKKNSVAILHDLYIDEMPKNYGFFQRLYYRFILIPSALKARCIVLTHSLKKRLITKHSKPGDDIYVYQYTMGMHAADRKMIETTEDKRWEQEVQKVLIVSSGVKNKNTGIMPDTIRRLSNVIQKQLNIIIVSNNRTIYKLIRRHEYPYNVNVEIKSDIDDNELSELYRTSNYYLTTSIIEGFGLGTREAYLFGCKIICVDTEVNREASRNSAIFIDKLESYKDIDKATNLQDIANVLSDLREIELSNQLIVEWIHR